MTDLREYLRTALADEPASTIDPYAAIDAGRHRRAVRHRWWAGATTVAVVAAVAVVGAVALRPARVQTAAGDGTATPTVSSSPFDPSTLDCYYYATYPTSVPVTHLPEGFGPISAAYVCDPGERKIDGTVHEVQVLNQLQGDLTELQSVLEQPDAAVGDGPCRAYGDLGRQVWVVGARGLVLTRLPFDECSHTDQAAASFLAGMARKELDVQTHQTATVKPKTPTKPASKPSAKALEKAKLLAEEHPCRADQLEATVRPQEVGTQGRGDAVELRNTSSEACGLAGNPEVGFQGAGSDRLEQIAGSSFVARWRSADPVAVAPGASAWVILSKFQCMISAESEMTAVELSFADGSVRVELPRRGLGAIGACADPDDSGNRVEISAYQAVGPK